MATREQRAAIVRTIKRWCEKGMVGRIQLPDGWVDDDPDCAYRLTWCDTAQSRLLLEFNESTLLIFANLETVYEEGDQLVLAGYAMVAWECLGDPPGVRAYVGSRVRLIRSGAVPRT